MDRRPGVGSIGGNVQRYSNGRPSRATVLVQHVQRHGRRLKAERAAVLPNHARPELVETPQRGYTDHGSTSNTSREKNALRPSVYAAIVANNQQTGWSPQDKAAVLRRNRQRKEARCFNCNELLSAGCGV